MHLATPYDVTTKSLLQAHPLDWLGFLGIKADSVEIVDADLSTIVAEADKALLLELPGREILNIEFQSGFKPDMVERFLEYSVLLRRRYRLPVRTIVMLMRPQADRDSLTGVLELTDSEDCT